MRYAPLLVIASVLAACGLDHPAPQVVGDGEIVADEAVYPAPAGPPTAAVAHGDGAAERIWESDAFVFATDPTDGLALLVTWDGAASRAAEEGGFRDEVTLPHPDLTVELQLGQGLTERLCNDAIRFGFTLVAADRPAATAGTVTIAVEPEPDAEEHFPTGTATFTLTDVVLDGEWRIEQVTFDGVLVGWLPG